MKILWLSHLLPYPPKGGVMQRSFNLIKELAKYHQVYLVGFYQTSLLDIHYKDRSSGLETGLSALRGLLPEVEFFPIPSDEIPFGKPLLAAISFFSPRGYTVEWLNSSRARRAIRRWSEKMQFDLVHFDTISLMQYRNIFSASTPVTIDHHNIESHMMSRRSGLEKSSLKAFYFWQEAKKLEYYERVKCSPPVLNLTCSELDSVRLKNLIPGANVAVVPNGVDLGYFSPKEIGKEIHPESFSVIFVGRLSAYTNVKAARKLVFDIWPLLSHRYPKARCIIAGSNPPADILRETAQNPTVEVTGFVDDIRPLIDSADIYICPITDGGGTKLKVLDALAMAKPLVADPIACEGIDVQNGKDVLFAETTDDYLNCVERIVNAPKMASSLRTNGRSLVEREYSYSSIGSKFSDTLLSYVQSFHER